MLRLLLLVQALAWPTLTYAETEVDVELFLAVDVSRSMQPWELEIQRRGYAEALRSDEVWQAMQRGLLQQIAITYVEWAGIGAHRTVVPWTLIASRADFDRVASQITAHFDPSLRRTSISSALDHASASLRDNSFNGLRRVIDVSGDGPNNAGGLVTTMRDQVVSEGITINGLPLMTYDPDEPFAAWGIPDLDAYYEACVIGGPGAFMIPVTEWDEFASAVRRKLVLEIAGPFARVWRVQAQGKYNCAIGEEIWERNRGVFSLP